MSTQGNILHAESIGCRVLIQRTGTSRTLENGDRERAANVFGTDAKFLRASKKLFDTKRPEYKEVTRVINATTKFWKLSTLPYTEPGVRLLRRSDVEQFSDKLEQFQRELDNAVESLNLCYAELLQEAEERLGDLFDPSDYPSTLVGSFKIDFDFPNLNPPDYLAELNPTLYARETARIQQQFETAAALAESAFAEELQNLINHITEVLAGGEDGKPKKFQESTVTNLHEFFDRFRHLSIGGNEQLEALVEEAKNAANGITADRLRKSADVREDFRRQIAEIGDRLSDAAVARPVRKLRVGKRKAEANAEAA